MRGGIRYTLLRALESAIKGLENYNDTFVYEEVNNLQVLSSRCYEIFPSVPIRTIAPDGSSIELIGNYARQVVVPEPEVAILTDNNLTEMREYFISIPEVKKAERYLQNNELGDTLLIEGTFGFGTLPNDYFPVSDEISDFHSVLLISPSRVDSNFVSGVMLWSDGYLDRVFVFSGDPTGDSTISTLSISEIGDGEIVPTLHHCVYICTRCAALCVLHCYSQHFHGDETNNKKRRLIYE